MKIKPTFDRVLVKPLPTETVTPSGLIIPVAAQQKQDRGTVIKVGNGKPGEPMSLKEGDSVLYHKGAGVEVEIDNEKYLIMREFEVIATI